MSVRQLHAEGRIRQGVNDRAFKFDYVILRQKNPSLESKFSSEIPAGDKGCDGCPRLSVCQKHSMKLDLVRHRVFVDPQML